MVFLYLWIITIIFLSILFLPSYLISSKLFPSRKLIPLIMSLFSIVLCSIIVYSFSIHCFVFFPFYAITPLTSHCESYIRNYLFLPNNRCLSLFGTFNMCFNLRPYSYFVLKLLPFSVAYFVSLIDLLFSSSICHLSLLSERHTLSSFSSRTGTKQNLVRQCIIFPVKDLPRFRISFLNLKFSYWELRCIKHILIVERLYQASKFKVLKWEESCSSSLSYDATTDNTSLSRMMVLTSSFISALFQMDNFLMKVLANVQLILKYTDSPFHGIVRESFSEEMLKTYLSNKSVY
jgi:hypothetical protein